MTTEQTRLAATQRHGRTDTSHDPILDDVTRLAAQICGAPVAGVSLLERGTVLHLGRYGFTLGSTPASELPIGMTVDAGAVHQMPHLRLENGDGPLDIVLEGHTYSSYAGAPLRTPEGVTVGALFVLNAVMKELSQEQMIALEALSRLATTRLTAQTGTEERLRRLIPQSNSVLESTGDGIYGIDLEGCVTVVNPAAAKMLGYRADELLGRNMHAMVHHSHADGTPYDEAECPIRRSLTGFSPLRVAHEVFWRKDGTSFPVEYIACPQIEHREGAGARAEETGAAQAGKGRPVGVVVAFTDISERNALDRMKDEFISTVSHELRTPLTSLRAALGLIAAGRLTADPDRTQQMMDIAVDSTDRLVRLVNDILDLERIGAGKAGMHFTQCSLETLFEHTAALLQSAAARAGVRLVLQAQGVSVWADPDRLLQTLTHLVSNAIKFAPDVSGKTESEVVMSAAYLSGAEASIEVRDDGPGIPENHLQTIFERFRQVDGSDSRALGGTGLGLAICRSIVRQHGGSIWATSTLGQGSTFHITLPTRSKEFLR